MSIIEEAVRKAAEQGAPVPLESMAQQRPLRRPAPSLVDTSQVRAYRRVTMDTKVLEHNCVLPRVTDRAALRAFKIMRTRVLRRLLANKWHSLMVTGIVPGEGKTLNAVNLAITLAQDVNTWVYLVDLDLQHPSVAATLGIECPAGLNDYLLGEASIDEIVYDIGLPRLAVIPSMRAVAHSSEHLTSPRMLDLLHALDKEAPRRIMIFDMPPLMASDDVLAFSPQADAVLLIVSEGMTKRSELHGAGEVLSEMNLLGVVLNRSRERNDNSYYGAEI
jgi:protein-tyrosine kinase